MKVARASAKRESPPEAVNIDDAPVGAIDAAPLLAWYDRHRRVLPWRAPAGARADPYHVWLSEIMLQQTTVKAVAPYYARFLARWPTMTALAAAPLHDVLREWAGLGYYARARNLHACAQAVAERHGGQLPADEAALRALPGIGAYTAAAVAAIAFNRVATPIDGNIERVMARLIACETPLPAAKAAIRSQAEAMTPHDRPGDFAQAMMDLGATICTPRNPACGLCPFRGPCRAQQRGDAETFPRKAPKRVGTLRRGAAFVLRRADGQVLLRTRPKRGLLGGMTEVPTTDWSPDFDVTRARQHAPQLAANGTPIRWRRIPGVVSHTFTHFPLELIVFTAEVPAGIPAPAETRWVAWEALAGEALPSVMRKVVALAQR